MKWKEFVTDYLIFTRKDRIGILVLLGLVSFIFLLPNFLGRTNHIKPIADDTAWVETLKKLEIKESNNDSTDDDLSYQYDRPKNNYKEEPKTELFFFDPNTISPEGWRKLGIKDRTIQTIQNYLSKGGHFKRAEDLQKIYGLSSTDYKRLAPFINIVVVPNKDIAINQEKELSTTFKHLSPRYSIIDINDSDTSGFISLPGIGNKLAARIINFREKLGGFYSIAQIGETFGLPDSTFQKIKQYLKLENATIRKININTATVDDLKAHPYIRWSIANPIVAYRNEHGPFAKIEDLKNIMAISDEVYNKIVYYLSVK